MYAKNVPTLIPTRLLIYIVLRQFLKLGLFRQEMNNTLHHKASKLSLKKDKAGAFLFLMNSFILKYFRIYC